MESKTTPTNLKSLLQTTRLQTSPTCGMIIVDNFYNNPLQVRDFVLSQEFTVEGNYPGKRTTSYATEDIRKILESYVEPFCGKITEFPLPNPENPDKEAENRNYNGSFQYTTSRDRSWIHTDSWNRWAGIVYLTPDAPLSSGTGFYELAETTCRNKPEEDLIGGSNEANRWSQDVTKWRLMDRAANVFNRLVLFDARRYHMSMDYFGDAADNGRLFQLFFFSTER